MTRKYYLELAPSLLLAVGIVVSTFIAVMAAESGWLVLAGPLGLALTVVSADMLDSRLRGESAGPSGVALIFGITFLLAGVIVALRDPSLVKMLIPVIGSTAGVTILLRSKGGRKPCRSYINQ